LKVQLLVGSARFWAQAAADIAEARSRVLVQAMTFEGDAAGQAVAEAVASSPAATRQILVDDYSRHVINDRFIRAPFAPAAVRAEAVATTAMFDHLHATGVGVRVTNPIGRNPARYATRNHKKLIVADGVCYIGGINFSDHNYAWHDMMLRIEEPACADFLAEDFAATWDSRPRYRSARFEDISLYALDGRENITGFADLFAAIASAKARIDIVSAYPTFPFIEALGQAAARGVAVLLYTPLPNNKPVVRDYLMVAAVRLGITVRLLPEMTHLKAMLIDNQILVAGSSNFDFVSYHVEEEFLAIIENPALAADFQRLVLAPAEAAALPAAAYPPKPFAAARAHAALSVASAFVKRMRTTPRRSVVWAPLPHAL